MESPQIRHHVKFGNTGWVFNTLAAIAPKLISRRKPYGSALGRANFASFLRAMSVGANLVSDSETNEIATPKAPQIGKPL